jgi:peptide/nickel transport system substrate-binding protein
MISASAAMIVTGCSSHRSGVDGDRPDGKTFTIATPTIYASLDPYLLTSGSGQRTFIDNLAYDPLINIGGTGALTSGLASDWQSTATSARFTLRHDVTCSDGSRLTASMVAADLNFVGDPKNQSSLAGSLVPAGTTYRATADDQSGVVTVTTNRPFGFLLQNLGLVPIVCAKGMRDRTMLANQSDGTGPYVLASSTQTTQIYMRREGYHWGPGGISNDAPGVPRTVKVVNMVNPATTASELLAGGISAAIVDGPDRVRLDAAKMPYSDIQRMRAELFFNHRPKRLSADPVIRLALVEALDLDGLAKVAGGSVRNRANGFRTGTPPVCGEVGAIAMLGRPDATHAGRMLDSAGWRRGGDGMRRRGGRPLALTVYYAGTQVSIVGTAEYVQYLWNQLGVEVTLHRMTMDEAKAQLYDGTGDFDVQLDAFDPPLPSGLAQFLSGPTPPHGSNFIAVANPAYDALSGQASQLTGPSACKLWIAAERALLADRDVVPISTVTVRMYFARGARGRQTRWQKPVPTSMRLIS